MCGVCPGRRFPAPPRAIDFCELLKKNDFWYTAALRIVCRDAHTHTHTHTHSHTRTRTRTRTRTHTHAHARTHANTHAHTHTRARTRTHTHTHRNAHARLHTHTFMLLSTHVLLESRDPHGKTNADTLVPSGRQTHTQKNLCGLRVQRHARLHTHTFMLISTHVLLESRDPHGKTHADTLVPSGRQTHTQKNLCGLRVQRRSRQRDRRR